MSKVQIKTLIKQAPNTSISDLIEPLPERVAAPDFPIDALGEILGEAAKRMAYHVQAGQGLAGQSVLAAASLVAQAHISIQRGAIGTSPASLFCLSIAESGDRKSTLDRLALEPIREYEAEQRDNLAAEQKRYAAQLETWLMQRESIISSAKPKKGAAEMTDRQREELTNKLSAHEEKKPQEPPRPNITFSEPTGVVADINANPSPFRGMFKKPPHF